MQIQELNNEEMYALFAPDGSWQAMSLAPDFPTCVAMVKMLHKSGLSKSFHEMTINGFKVMPVKVTIVQNGTEEEGFQKAKEAK